MEKYLCNTKMLDFEVENIQRLIRSRGWKSKEAFQKILEVYEFVRDEVLFGYNRSHSLPASQVLQVGYGQCNTKGTLFMALLRAVGIPCRLHGFTIDKALQKGAMTGFVYHLAPQNVVRSWVEVYFEDKWFNLEGFILDIAYLMSTEQMRFANRICIKSKFCSLWWQNKAVCHFRCIDDCLFGFAGTRRKSKVQGFLPCTAKNLASEQNKNRVEALI